MESGKVFSSSWFGEMTPLTVPAENRMWWLSQNNGTCCESSDELQMNYRYPTFYCSIVLPSNIFIFSKAEGSLLNYNLIGFWNYWEIQWGSHQLWCHWPLAVNSQHFWTNETGNVFYWVTVQPSICCHWEAIWILAFSK